MKNNAKRGKISPVQLFFILLVSRLVVTLTYIQTVSLGKLSSDLLISIAFACLFTLLMSMPAYICVIKNKNPFHVKWVAVFYAVYFIYSAAVNISRFSYFASSRLNPDTSMVFFIIIITAAVCYAAAMGIESLGRFGVFCGAVLIIAVLVVAVFNIDNVTMINYYPLFLNTRSEIFEDSAVITANTIEPALFLALSGRVNGKKAKPLFLGITASFVTIFLLIFLCMGVMGSAASLQSYPIFTLFQMASIGSFSRLDMFHTAFWIFGLFLKCSVLVYASSAAIKKFTHKTKCIAVALIVGAAAIIITEIIGTRIVTFTKIVSISTFVLFSIIIPVISLFAVKSKGENLIERL